MANSDATEAVIKLASSVVKIASKAVLGDAGEVASTLTDFIGKKVKDLINRRKVAALFDDCVTSVAEQTRKFLVREFRDVAEADIAVIVEVAREVFVKADPELAVTVGQTDLNSRMLYRVVAPIIEQVSTERVLSSDEDNLLKKIVRETCAHLSSVATKLPRYSETVLIDLIEKSNQISQDVRHILERMPPARTSDDFATDYERAVVSRLDQMEIFGLHQVGMRHYPLSVSYVSLHVRSYQNNNSENKYAKGSTRISNLRVEEALADRNKIFLIGDAGSGKTTLLRWLAVSCARQNFSGNMADWNKCTPFFIALRDYTNGTFPAPSDFPDMLARNFSEEMPKFWVHKKMRSGKALVMIDGIDELSDEAVRTRAYKWISGLTDDFPDARFIVTSRPAAVDAAQLQRFFAVDLQPMTPEDVVVFVRRWHQAVATELATDEEKTQLEDHEMGLLAAITIDRHLRQLAVNPLLCAMLCTLNRERDADLPKDRLEIYEAGLAMLLGNRDRGRGITVHEHVPSSLQASVLQDLAFWLMRQGESTVAAETAEHVIAKTLRSFGNADYSAEAFLKLLLERSGLLWEPQRGKISFIHRTFQEYLAGKAAVESNEIGMLLRNADTDHGHWRDAIIMAAGHAQPRQREELIEGLLERGVRARSQELSLLAIACLQTRSKLDDAVRRKVEALARELLPPQSFEAAESLAHVGDLILEVLHDPARQPRNVEQALCTVRLLAVVGGDESMELIKDLARRFQGLDSELLNAWRLFDRSVFADRVVRHATFEHHLVVKEAEILPHLHSLTTVRSLRLDLPNLVSFTSISGRPAALRSVTVIRRARAGIEGIQQLDSLDSVEIDIQNTSPDLAPLGEMQSLTSVSISIHRPIGAILNVEPLSRLKTLTTLTIRSDGEVNVDISPLKLHKRLVVRLAKSVRTRGTGRLQPDAKVLYLG